MACGLWFGLSPCLEVGQAYWTALAMVRPVANKLTIDELFDRWRIENPSDEQYAENVAAIRASIADYQAGERGTVAGAHLDPSRQGRGGGDVVPSQFTDRSA